MKVDLAKDTDKEPRYRKVKLLFDRGINDKPDYKAGRKDWALFLATDSELSSVKMLQTYALSGVSNSISKKRNNTLDFYRHRRRLSYRTRLRFTYAQCAI